MFHAQELRDALKHAVALLDARADRLRDSAAEIKRDGGLPDLIEAPEKEASRHANTLAELDRLDPGSA